MKYLKLYFAYARNSLIGKLTYKANVIIGVLAFLITQGFALATLFILVNTVPSIDGYDMYQIGFLFGITNLAAGIDHLFTDRLWTVAYHEVKTGKLDNMMLRPVPLLFQVIASEIQLEALGEIIIAIALMVVCGANLDFKITFSNISLLIIGILCAAIIITSFKILIAGLAFVFKNSGPLLQIVYNFSNYSKYPLTIFPKVIQYVLLFVIPLGLCIFVPFDNLFNSNVNELLTGIIILVAGIIFCAFSVFVWSKCVQKYESTGT